MLTRREKVTGQIEVSDRRIFVAEMLSTIIEPPIHTPLTYLLVTCRWDASAEFESRRDFNTWIAVD